MSIAPLSNTIDDRLDGLTAQYSAGELDRSHLISQLTGLTGSVGAAHLLIEQSGLSRIVSSKESDRLSIVAEDVTYTSGETLAGGYLATPKGEGPFPAVLVIHENRGLNEHTRDVARRFATEGFVALAPDALTRVGGTAFFATHDEARAAIGTITLETALADLEAGLAFLNDRPEVQTGRLGSIGFCWGGARSFALATQSPRLAAAVVFYGSAPAEEKLPDLKVPVLGIYGSLDTRITSEVPGVAEKLQSAGKAYEYKIYEGANHAFFNDAGERYDTTAAEDAWARAVQFLRSHL